MGGFGRAARAVAECLLGSPELGYRPLCLGGEGELGSRVRGSLSGEVPVIPFARDRSYRRRLAKCRPALALTIDYRPNYAPVLAALDGCVLVVWIRDPRTPEDHARIASLRLPGVDAVPEGIDPIDCTSLAAWISEARSRGRTVLVTSVAPTLASRKSRGAYGLEHETIGFLPNPLETVDLYEESREPRVVFLGRLDPIKRPWVFIELARRFPAVEFLVLGQSHFVSSRSWRPFNVPENVRLLGQVDNADARAILGSAWVLVNTSIHEGLALSFLEALHAGTPIVAGQDPEDVVSRFGRHVGYWGSDGLGGVDAYATALEELLDDEDLRHRLGHEGREWVRRTHTRERFLIAFERLAHAP